MNFEKLMRKSFKELGIFFSLIFITPFRIISYHQQYHYLSSYWTFSQFTQNIQQYRKKEEITTHNKRESEAKKWNGHKG